MVLQENKQHPRFLLYTSVAGTVSGITTKFLVHPLDTLKNKLQVDTMRIGTKNVSSHFLYRMTINTWKNEGMKGFYKGVGLSAVGSAPAYSLFMTLYEFTKQQLKKVEFFNNWPFISYMVSGFMAELGSCILWLPIDVIKQRQQVQFNLGFYNYKNSFDAFQQIISKEGIRALYKGFGATLITFGTSIALYFSIYEKLKEKYVEDPKNIGFLKSLMLAAIAGSFSGFICNPISMYKLRLQVQQENCPTSFKYVNIFQGIQDIYVKEGFLAFFKGVGTKILMNTPQKSLSLSITEIVRKWLINWDELAHSGVH